MCAVGLWSLALVGFGLSCSGGGAVSDGGPWWDGDGDTISTAVELEAHNLNLYGFDTTIFNFNPSRASGTRANGTLTSGLNLPDTGYGYIHYRNNDAKDTDDWGTLALVNVVEQVGRWFRRRPCQNLYPNADALARAQTGDMSLQYGGPFVAAGDTQHTEHQNGLDVDVRYVRRFGEGPLNLANPLDSADFDRPATAELMSCFLQTDRLVRVYYDSARSGIRNAPGSNVFRHLAGHSNHFHVSIADPDGP